jgi:catechol 2,3-dioxygenase-like lactoylglutathione lyase family enzyme
MTAPTRPVVDCDRIHPVLTVSDVVAAVDFYVARLGFERGFIDGDPPRFAGVTLDEVQLFLRQGTPQPDGCAVFFVVGDADALHEFQRSKGVEVVEPPGDRPYGLRDYAVRDLEGHHLSFGHNVYNTGEPLPIERVDVPVRLERRLAALLADLAEHKRMSIDSCLEETLLHTFEPFGEGVASPHTRTTLRVIQELKHKHGIDYDCHASYRFVEAVGEPDR